MHQTTDLQCLYWADCLTLISPHESYDSLARSMASARVELNPHQVDAALFAFRSPFSQGGLLADEVGLGKTIEAGIVLLQFWAERKRQLLLIVPASLRSQWQAELIEKFGIPSVIAEDKFWQQERSKGMANPFKLRSSNPQAYICSYHFAAKHEAELAAVNWDLVVCDEAHRLRGLHKTGGNKIAQSLLRALKNKRKLLLTATPLQNDLLELWSLIQFIDPHVFGSKESFRAQFIKSEESEAQLESLRKQLNPFCKRTLRKDVQQYVRFTKRIAHLVEFTPSQDEHQLYLDVSEFLRREELVCLPHGQRHLLTLILRKLLASSSFAITDTLKKLLERLKEQNRPAFDQVIEQNYETYYELNEEWSEEDAAQHEQGQPKGSVQELIAEEITLLQDITARAQTIETNSKGNQLLIALQQVFGQTEALKAARKAVIFTESTRTQSYLFQLLEANGYVGQVVLINGQNKDERSKQILKDWKERHRESELIRREEAVNLKAALVEEFRDRGTILVATDAAAEGINLQFCSLVVNYDLPWNPQRIEQRIGRCHRYGQQHDVVVVNFLNMLNDADRRVYEILDLKFKLFDGVFGSSDEVLGAVESGVDIEKSIARIYQECRTSEEIARQFDELQLKLDSELRIQKENTRKAVLDHFDESVAERLAVHEGNLKKPLDKRQTWLLKLTRQTLGATAVFSLDEPRFDYQVTTYHLNWRTADENGLDYYHEQHPLAQQVIDQALQRATSPQLLVFDYTGSGRKLSAIEQRVGQSGWLQVDRLRYAYEAEPVEYLLLACIGDTESEPWDEELAAELLELPASAHPWSGDWPSTLLNKHLDELQARRHAGIEERNNRFIDEEIDKIEFWKNNQLATLELQVKECEKEVRQLKRKMAKVKGKEKIEFQKRIRDVESNKRHLRNQRDQEEERIDNEQKRLIDEAEARLKAQGQRETRIQIRWQLV